jgi:dihydroneopterin aldolase
LELHAFHGCFAHERQHGQWFSLELRLDADLSEAAASDDLATAIDYGKVVSVVEQTFCGKPRHLVEAAAFDIGRALLDGFPRIEAITVKVVKLRAAGVEIEVRRG